MNVHRKLKIRRAADTAFELFGDHLWRFRQDLVNQNRDESTVSQNLGCIYILAKMMRAEKLALKDLDETQASRVAAKTGWSPRRRVYAASITRRFIRFLSTQGVGKPPVPLTAKEIVRVELRQNYENYLRHQRGLSERTVSHYWQIADRFLKFRFGEEVWDPSQITSSDIVRFLQYLITRNPQRRDKSASCFLRNFFRYLFTSGVTVTNLAMGIPRVARRYGARLPRHLTSGHVEILLNAARSDTRRNYAMVLLLARLGLRAQEVIAMQVDDIDWRSGEVLVRGKGKRHDRVPLPADVGKALTDYIALDRITTSRALFVGVRSPHRPFRDSDVINIILKNAFAKTDLIPPPPYVGSHILRHSLATNLVRRGAPLEEIGDMLRHRTRASTMIYARLDVDGLRSIAQPWPVAGGAE